MTAPRSVGPRSVEDLRLTFEATRTPRGPLMLASDASEASDAIFPLARELAAHCDADVEVISAVQPNALPTYGFEALPYPAMPMAELLTERSQQIAAQATRQSIGANEWPITIRVGDSAREIISVARERDARLLVVGRGRHALVERLFTGETVLRLLQLGDTPVFAVDAHLSQLPSRVMIATDFSVFSIYAAQVALDFVAKNAQVELVHVAPSLSETGAALKEFATEYRNQAAASFTALIERIQRPGMQFTTTLLDGHPGNQLVAHLREHPADLVVTATHGYGFVRRMMLGSVAATLIRQAPCSVLCVPGSARTRAAARAKAASRTERTLMLADDQIAAQLDAFTERHRGRGCFVEVHQHDIGVQPLGHHLPLQGVTWESDTRSVVLMFGSDHVAGAHLAHAIGGVQQVAILVDAEGNDQILELAYPSGETLVVLE
ncbi:MAG: universal stress protein [Gemmatimonadaceae bacterium]|nr:universal stress protein [Gemmatimonadaceae bacterium]